MDIELSKTQLNLLAFLYEKAGGESSVEISFGFDERTAYAELIERKKNTVDKDVTSLLENGLIKKVRKSVYVCSPRYCDVVFTEDETDFIFKIPKNCFHATSDVSE